MKFKTLLAAGTLAAVSVLAPVAQAGYVLAFQGVTFTIDTVDADSLSVRIQNALSTTDPSWAAATHLGAFSLKSIGLDFSVVDATATYLGNSTAGVRDELNNGGADVNCTEQLSGQKGSVCFDFDPNILLTDDMIFAVDFTANYTIGANGPHMKVAFTDNAGEKVGSLMSQDIPSTSTSSTSTSGQSSTSGDIPEPSSSSLAILGLGLVGAGFAFRRKSRQV